MMRTIVQLGGKGNNRALVELRRRKLRELLEGLEGDGKEHVVRLYGEYARLQVAGEKRLTYRLPLIGDEAIVEAGATREVPAVVADLERIMEPTLQLPRWLTVEEEAEGRRLEYMDPTFPIVEEDSEMEDAPVIQSIEAPHTGRDTALSPSPDMPLPTPLGVRCDEHTTADTTCTMITVQNLEDFWLQRVQEVQAQYYPSTQILAMQIHRADNNTVTKVTADIADGSVDQLQINNPRIIAALGVHLPSYDSILLQAEDRIDETYKIRVLPGQRRNDPKAVLIGELIPARHAFLYWLDSRKSADPKGPPTATEARMLARKVGRRALDVMNEIERYWKLEQGSGGRHYRENRVKYLGEDPEYLMALR
jgi:hypothetical protein